MDTKKIGERIGKSIIDVIREVSAEEKITPISLDDLLLSVTNGCASFMISTLKAAGIKDPFGPVADIFMDAAEQVEKMGGEE